MRFPLLLLLALPGCTAPKMRIIGPSHVVTVHGIVVRAEDIQEGERMAGEFAELDRKVRALLGVSSPPTPEFWLLEHEIAKTANGASSFIPPIVGLGVADHDNLHVAAHELAHHYSRRWPSKLPTVVEEGLADLVGGLVRNHVEEVRERYGPILERTRVESLRNLLRFSDGDVRSIQDERVSHALRSVGFTIADRIGIEGLRRMCLRASQLDLEIVPVGWFEPTWAEVSPRSYQGTLPSPDFEVVTFF